MQVGDVCTAAWLGGPVADKWHSRHVLDPLEPLASQLQACTNACTGGTRERDPESTRGHATSQQGRPKSPDHGPVSPVPWCCYCRHSRRAPAVCNPVYTLHVSSLSSHARPAPRRAAAALCKGMAEKQEAQPFPHDSMRAHTLLLERSSPVPPVPQVAAARDGGGCELPVRGPGGQGAPAGRALCVGDQVAGGKVCGSVWECGGQLYWGAGCAGTGESGTCVSRALCGTNKARMQDQNSPHLQHMSGTLSGAPSQLMP